MEKIKIAFFFFILRYICNTMRGGREGKDMISKRLTELQINYKAILDQTFDAEMFVKKA